MGEILPITPQGAAMMANRLEAAVYPDPASTEEANGPLTSLELPPGHSEFNMAALSTAGLIKACPYFRNIASWNPDLAERQAQSALNFTRLESDLRQNGATNNEVHSQLFAAMLRQHRGSVLAENRPLASTSAQEEVPTKDSVARTTAPADSTAYYYPPELTLTTENSVPEEFSRKPTNQITLKKPAVALADKRPTSVKTVTKLRPKRPESKTKNSVNKVKNSGKQPRKLIALSNSHAAQYIPPPAKFRVAIDKPRATAPPAETESANKAALSYETLPTLSETAPAIDSTLRNNESPSKRFVASLTPAEILSHIIDDTTAVLPDYLEEPSSIMLSVFDGESEIANESDDVPAESSLLPVKPEVSAPIYQVEAIVDNLVRLLEETDPVAASRWQPLIEQIAVIVNDDRPASESNGQLGSLLSELLEIAGIDLNPAIIEPLVKVIHLTLPATDLAVSRQPANTTAITPEQGTREYLQRLTDTIGFFKLALVRVYEIGRTIIHLYHNSNGEIGLNNI